jgi:hypothetical protein
MGDLSPASASSEAACAASAGGRPAAASAAAAAAADISLLFLYRMRQVRETDEVGPLAMAARIAASPRRARGDKGRE